MQPFRYNVTMQQDMQTDYDTA